MNMESTGNVPGGCVCFELDNEGHTLGNALRCAIVKNQEVEHSGYAITHPSEKCIQFQVQMIRGSKETPVQAVIGAAHLLESMSRDLKSKMTAGLHKYLETLAIAEEYKVDN